MITTGVHTSTAAGRCQFLYRTWMGIKTKLGLPDFSPRNQDIAALELIRERGQLGKLLSGDFEGMIRGLGCAWAALPYSTCRQKMRSLAATMNYYHSALKVYGGSQPLPGGTPATLSGGSEFIKLLILTAAALAIAKLE